MKWACHEQTKTICNPYNSVRNLYAIPAIHSLSYDLKENTLLRLFIVIIVKRGDGLETHWCKNASHYVSSCTDSCRNEIFHHYVRIVFLPSYSNQR